MRSYPEHRPRAGRAEEFSVDEFGVDEFGVEEFSETGRVQELSETGAAGRE
jgi:hypothetical protein